MRQGGESDALRICRAASLHGIRGSDCWGGVEGRMRRPGGVVFLRLSFFGLFGALFDVRGGVEAALDLDLA